MTTETFVYAFDATTAPELAADMGKLKALLGGKGAGLNVMTHLEIPVPPGFTISTPVCNHYREAKAYPEGLDAQMDAAIGQMEAKTGRTFGDASHPLLVSVRSGARVSMPGMMDTILNLGLNDETVEGLATESGDRRFAFDAYRRLLQMYGDVVLGVAHERFEEVLSGRKAAEGNPKMLDSELSASALEMIVAGYKALLEQEGKPFPQSVQDQLWGAITAVFSSWDNARAFRYRKMQGIPHEWGTACNIQAMVFGNMGTDSGSGVCFTRNPSTGEKLIYGEYLENAQGEDVVAGIRTPRALTAAAAAPGKEDATLERTTPAVFNEIIRVCDILEGHFGDMQDIEFTVEKGKVYILQTRTGKRTAHAAVKIAVDLVNEGAISKEQALLQVEPNSLSQLLHARLPEPDELAKQGVHALASGLPASPGAAVGKIVFHADTAETMANDGEEVILVRRETSPEDIHGMKAAKGIVTATGGMTSHAAVVARGLGKCCVAGCAALDVDYKNKTLTVRLADGTSTCFNEGEVISLDGTFGKLYGGALDVVAAAKVAEFETIMEWADETRRMKVRANADTPRGAKRARSYGAQGIGLCRTEHMFFADERLEAVRATVLAPSEEVRAKFLAKILPMQRQDFLEIFEAMDGLPVTVRLLDWPLHEFLPHSDGDILHIAEVLGESEKIVRARAQAMHEVNPMIGHRGVRVGLTVPAIYRTQVRAILEAALDAKAKGVDARPEIMIPVVGIAKELVRLEPMVREEAEAVFTERGERIDYKFGSMIELPRACLVADKLAETAEFFSFGTNDLTQTTFGISRDDSAHFLPAYADDLGVIAVDPFQRLDEEGVGQLVQLASERARKTRPEISLGVCGEHGGDPESVDFCERVGLGYVSCSPPRLPIARLAAAQATLRNRG